jgi:transcriptional regulator GlxA family with amidase domain
MVTAPWRSPWMVTGGSPEASTTPAKMRVSRSGDNARPSGNVRTFERRFAAETGHTPIKWLTAARVDRARELLETTDATVSRISQLCELGTPANLRQHFRRATGTTPREYRRVFVAA